jgi:hypothetical protein
MSIAMRSIGNPVSTICIGALFFLFGGFFCEQNETSGGNKHILVISDYYIKWTECFAMPNMEAKIVAKLLVEEVIVRFGTPYVIHTDQGVQFEKYPCLILARAFRNPRCADVRLS